MIVKTLYTKNSAMGWIGYIAYKSKLADVERSAKGIFNATGRRARKDDVRWIVEQSLATGLARMIIFAPADYVHPIFLAEYTRMAMWKFLREDARNSVRFVYALHYNTAHPHSHVVMASYFADDLVMYREDIARMKKFAEEVFREMTDVKEKVQKGKIRGKHLQRIAMFEEQIEREQEEEVKEMRKYLQKFNRTVKTVDDLMREIEMGL